METKTVQNNLFNYDDPVPAKITYSMIFMYNECPLRYKLTYIDKITTGRKQRHYLLIGLTLHNVLYDFFSLDKSERTKEKIINILNKRWFRWKVDREKETDSFNQCRKILSDFYDQFPVKSDVVKLEHGFAIVHGKDVLNGKIDRIDKLPDGTYEIIDYKFGDETGKSEQETKNDLQWYIYFSAFKRLFPDMKVSTISFYYLNAMKKISFKPTNDDEEGAAALLNQQIAKMKDKKTFTKHQGRYCKDCYFFNKECSLKEGEKQRAAST